MAKKRTSIVRYVRSKARRSKAKMTIPIAVIAGFVPVVNGVWNRRNSGQAISDYLQTNFTGITPGTGQFSFGNLKGGLLPIIMGFAVHMVASKVGINRAIGRASIPFIRI